MTHQSPSPRAADAYDSGGIDLSSPPISAAFLLQFPSIAAVMSVHTLSRSSCVVLIRLPTDLSTDDRSFAFLCNREYKDLLKQSF